MPAVRVRLAITTDELLRYYSGEATVVRARNLDQPSTVQFPARALRPFVTADGVFGIFQLWFTHDHRLREIRQLSNNGAVLRRS